MRLKTAIGTAGTMSATEIVSRKGNTENNIVTLQMSRSYEFRHEAT